MDVNLKYMKSMCG